jgi:hypothetical protein
MAFECRQLELDVIEEDVFWPQASQGLVKELALLLLRVDRV